MRNRFPQRYHAAADGDNARRNAAFHAGQPTGGQPARSHPMAMWPYWPARGRVLRIAGGMPHGGRDMLERTTEPAQPAAGSAAAHDAPAHQAPARPDDFPSLHSEPAAPRDGEAIAARIAAWERELRARGGDPALHREIGRLWEIGPRSPRNAAIAYQNAYRLDRAWLPTLKAARRLFSEVGNWQMAAQLLEAEAEAAAGDPKRAALLHFERGLVLEERLGRRDAARALYQRALELDPACLPALLHVAAQHAGEPAALAATLERIAAAAGDVALRARALAAAAALYEDRLGSPDEAARLWEAAFAADGSDRLVARRLALHLERQGRHRELAAVLRAEIERGGQEGAAAAWRLGRVLLRAGAEDEALEALLQARRLAPRDRLVLGELAAIYEARCAWAELAGVLEESVRAAGDEAERIALRLQLGAIYDERLGRRDDAIASYDAVLAVAPHHPGALAALGRLHHQAGDWPRLLATFEAEAAAAEDPRQRAARLYKAALLLEEKLDRADEAIARHEAILQLAPGFLPSMQALERLLAARGRWAELIALLEQELAATGDRDQQLHLLGRIAAIQERWLEDRAAAIATHRRMLALAPDHLPTIRSLARLGEEAGAWEELVFALEREAARSPDRRQVIALLHRNAEILEERIGDPARAAAIWERILTLAPNYLPALRAMGRLHAAAGRWEELVAMHRREAEVTADPRAAAAILCRVGELCEQALGDEARALATWREVLRLDPGHIPALQRLARIHRARGAWEELVGVLREEANARTAPAERAAVFCRIAEILEEQLGRADAARDAWQEALRLQPDHPVALQGLERIFSAAGAWRELAAIYERQLARGSGASRAAAWVRLAELYLDRLGAPGRAGQCCEAALDLEPGHLAALHLLERIRTLQGDRHRRAEVRSRLASALTEPAARAALMLAANADRERVEGTGSAAELEEAMRLDPGDRAFEALQRALARSGDHAAVAEALAARVEVERDPALRVALLHDLARLRERELRDPAGARAALEAALATDPAHLPVLADLGRLLEQEGAWAALHANLRAQAAALRDTGLAVERLHRAATVAESRLGDMEAAQADLRAILERAPDDREAMRRLEELVAAGGGVEELVRLHERRAATAVEAADAAEAWAAAARLRHDRLADEEGALAALDRALALAPEHPDALERRGRILLGRGRWQEAAEAFAARARLGGRGAAEAHFQLGRLWAEHLGDPARAVGHLDRAVAADPENVEALRLLAQLHAAAANHAGALEALRRLAPLVREPAAAAAIHGEIARLQEEAFGDLAGAAATMEQVLALDPAQEGAWQRLALLYERVRDLPRLVSTLERWAAGVPATEAAVLLSRAAAIYAVPLRDPGKAIERWKEAVALDGTCLEARWALADRLDPAEAVEHHAWLVALDPLRVASWQALLAQWRGRGEEDRAFLAAGLLHALGALPDADRGWYEARRAALRLPALLPADVRLRLTPEEGRSPLADLVAVLCQEIGGVVPPQLERWQVGKADRLRPEHPLRIRFEALLRAVGGDAACGLYLSPVERALAVEPTAPPAVVVGGAVAEDRFLLARLAWSLAERNFFLHQLPVAEVASILGAAVQLHEPAFEGLGPVDAALSRKLGKLLSRRSRRAVEEAARAIAAEPAPWDAAAFVDAVRQGADRIGLLLCGDLGAALEALLAEEAPGLRPDDRAARETALGRSRRALALVAWATGEDHLFLRRRLGSALGG